MKRIILVLLIILALGLISAVAVYVRYQSGRMRSSTTTQTTLPVVKQSQGRIIAGFPDFPIFPGATITSTQQTAAVDSPFPQPASYQAYLESDQSVSTIIDWYGQSLKKSDWTITRPADKTDQSDQNIVASKGKLTATVNVEKETNGSMISIYIK